MDTTSNTSSDIVEPVSFSTILATRVEADDNSTVVDGNVPNPSNGSDDQSVPMNADTSSDHQEIEVPVETINKPKRNESYYFTDEAVTVAIENEIFAVHKQFLTNESEVFHSMLKSAGENGVISLSGITAQEFKTFLNYIYAPLHVNNDKNIEVCLDLLSVSHQYVMEDLFKSICSKLDPVIQTEVSVAQRLRLGKKYDLRNWISSAYMQLVDGQLLPDNEETTEVLGYEGYRVLANAREKSHNAYCSSGRRATHSVDPELLEQFICTLK